MNIYEARDLGAEPLESLELEYPAGTVWFVAFTIATSNSVEGFFAANVWLLSACAFGTLVLLGSSSADVRRTLLFAAASPLALYAFYNWDLLAVTFFAAGLFAFLRRRDGASGLLLGLGAATKLFPGLALLPLAIARWREAKPEFRGRAIRPFVGWAAVGIVLPNAALLAVSSHGWAYFFQFQADRHVSRETLSWWYYIWQHFQGLFEGVGLDQARYAAAVNMISPALLIVLSGWLLTRAVKLDTLRPIATTLGLVCAFLLTAKVFSLQYSLWLLPLLVLVRIPWPLVGAYMASEIGLWFAFNAFFHPVYNHLSGMLIEVMTFARYIVVGLIMYSTVKAEEMVISVPISDAAAQ